MGKRRDVLMVQRGRTCQTVGGKTPEILSDDAKTRAGGRAIWSAPGVMLVELRQAESKIKR